MKRVLFLLLTAIIAIVFGVSCKKTHTVGEAGPAGGIVFYDKGEYSDGWRYLEAAPGFLCMVDGKPCLYIIAQNLLDVIRGKG